MVNLVAAKPVDTSGLGPLLMLVDGNTIYGNPDEQSS